MDAKVGVVYQSPCKGCNYKHGKTLKIRMAQHKKAVRIRYMSYLTTVQSFDTGHHFAFDEVQIIG